jgi:2-succinyl-5-enolpyruvyl-6-hydroxy-3-cyclohexene-1-carboxylate synthase
MSEEYTKPEVKELFTTEQLAQDHILIYFGYEHLKPELQQFSKPWADLAVWVIENIPRNAERTISLRKLLEAKDACVRASLNR